MLLLFQYWLDRSKARYSCKNLLPPLRLYLRFLVFILLLSLLFSGKKTKVPWLSVEPEPNRKEEETPDSSHSVWWSGS